jgi:imidazolonepropionase-like amidohydrolase
MRRIRRPFVLLAPLVAAGLALAAQAPTSGQAPALFITGATLIDGTGAQPVPQSAILVRGNRIEQVGRAADLKAPAGAKVINAEGKYVLPGLWESHMHYRAWHGELLLHYGITTAVDMGSQLDWIVAVKDGIAKGKVRAPRLLVSGWILHGTPPGGGGGGHRRPLEMRSEAYQTYHPRENWPNHMFVRGGPEKMRAFVRTEIDAGVDMLKVFPDIASDELRVITEEADKAGIAVIGHTVDVYQSVKDGVDGFTHLQGVARTLLTPEKMAALGRGELNSAYTWMQRDKMDELISFMVKNNIFLGPCLIHDHPPAIGLAPEFEKEDQEILGRPELNYLHDDTRLAMRDYLHMYRSDTERYGEFPIREYLPADVVEEHQRGYENAKEFLRRYAKAGGRLFIGTDLGGTAFVPGLIVHREMQVWVEEVGLTPMQAIIAATRDSAAALKKEKTMGTVEAGKIADLLIVSADPLANIRNTQKIDTVIVDGAIVDRTLNRDYTAPFREVGSEGAQNTGHAVPSIIGLTPRVAVEGAADTTVKVEATGLHQRSKVYVDGQLVPSRMLDGEHLEFTVPARLLTRGGTLAVTIFNGAPGGGMSKPYAFIVRFK